MWLYSVIFFHFDSRTNDDFRLSVRILNMHMHRQMLVGIEEKSKSK